MFPNDETPDPSTLPDLRVPLREEGEAFARPDDSLTQVASCNGIVLGAQSDDVLEIVEERVPEDYLEIHSPRRPRASVPEPP